jgi:hypothetical protein
VGESGLLRSVPFPVNKGEGSFRFAHVRLGERHHLRTGKEDRTHLSDANVFSASGQDYLLWIDVFSQNQFRRICLIN